MISAAAPPVDALSASSTRAAYTAQSSSFEQEFDREEICQWITDIKDPEMRETAMSELKRKKDCVPELPLWLWYSFRTMTVLIQEVTAAYPSVIPSHLTSSRTNRARNALALMQCVVRHEDTRGPFLRARNLSYLYPFLQTTEKCRYYESLRLASLKLIGTLVKTDDEEVISFLLSNREYLADIIPLCLGIMQEGTERSKAIAATIIQRILFHDTLLAYVCKTYERFNHLASTLERMVLELAREPSSCLLKHVIRCYSCLSVDWRAQQVLRQRLPDQLKDGTFKAILDKHKSIRVWLNSLMRNLGKLLWKKDILRKLAKRDSERNVRFL